MLFEELLLLILLQSVQQLPAVVLLEHLLGLAPGDVGGTHQVGKYGQHVLHRLSVLVLLTLLYRGTGRDPVTAAGDRLEARGQRQGMTQTYTGCS